MDHEKESDRLLIEFSVFYKVSMPPIPNFKKEDSPREAAPQSKVLQIEEEN